MSEFAKDGVTDAANLLMHYGFDLGGHSLDRLIDRWLRTYPRAWLRGAAIEALYQGRYKAFSVEQILAVWRRKGQPLQHFNHEFERIVCSVLPKSVLPESVLPKPEPLPLQPSKPAPLKMLAQLSPLEDAINSQLATSDRSSQPSGSAPDSTDSIPPPASAPAAPELIAGSVAVANSAAPPCLPAEAAQPAPKLIHQPIHQFVPARTASEFYSKLKAVAEDDRLGENSTSLALMNDRGF